MSGAVRRRRMKNGLRRLLAALLCLVLCVSVLPVPAAAEAGTISAAGDGTIEKAAESGSIAEAAVSGEETGIIGGQDPENGAVLREEVYINPLYADVISEEDLVRPKRDAKSRASGEVYSTEEEAGVYVREHMRNREETIVVLVAYSVYQDNPSGFLRGIKSVAMAHTGDPTEGDYILWQYAGWKGEAKLFINGEEYYVQVTYTVTYYTSAEQELEMDRAVADLLDSLELRGKSRYETIYTIYNYITNVVSVFYLCFICVHSPTKRTLLYTI